MLPAELKQFFLEQVPASFLKASIDVINTGYKTSHMECTSGFLEPEARDLYGHHRRATTEMGWRTMAQRHGLTAVAEANSRKTYNHTRVTCGEVLMTQSFVRHSGQLVRPADFRGTLAQDNQLSIFDPPGGRAATSL